MRLAQVVSLQDGCFEVPAEFMRPLSWYENARVYVQQVKCEEGDEKPSHWIISTLPPRCWLTIARVSVRLEHKSGTLRDVASMLEKHHFNILIMEGYGRDPDKEGWLSAVVDFSILRKDVFENDGEARVVDADRVRDALKRAIQSFMEDYVNVAKKAGNEYQGPAVEQAPAGSEGYFRFVVTAKDAFKPKLLVESMALSEQWLKMVDSKVSDSSAQLVGRMIEVTKNSAEKKSWKRGLLMCNTDERFLRFVNIEDPVEINLGVKTTGPPDKVGVGVLKAITEVLAGASEWGEDEHGEQGKDRINIIFTYNYLTAIEWPRKRDKICTERSTIKLFLEDPEGHISDKAREELWKRILRRLLEAKRPDDSAPFIQQNEVEMKLWGNSIEEFFVNKDGVIRPKKWHHHLLEKFQASRNPWLVSQVVLALVCVILIAIWPDKAVGILSLAVGVYSLGAGFVWAGRHFGGG